VVLVLEAVEVLVAQVILESVVLEQVRQIREN
jgi:hypothetical protein